MACRRPACPSCGELTLLLGAGVVIPCSVECLESMRVEWALDPGRGRIEGPKIEFVDGRRVLPTRLPMLTGHQVLRRMPGGVELGPCPGPGCKRVWIQDSGFGLETCPECDRRAV